MKKREGRREKKVLDKQTIPVVERRENETGKETGQETTIPQTIRENGEAMIW